MTSKDIRFRSIIIPLTISGLILSLYLNTNTLLIKTYAGGNVGVLVLNLNRKMLFT